MDSVRKPTHSNGQSSNFIANSLTKRTYDKSNSRPTKTTDFYYLNEEEIASFRTHICGAVSSGLKCPAEDKCLHSHCSAWQRRNPYNIPYWFVSFLSN